MKLTVCPFSILVFFSTAALYTYNEKKKKRRSDGQESNTSRSTEKALDCIDTTTSVNVDNITLPVCHVVFVLGAPGVGKGTQCQMLSERRRTDDGKPMWIHLSAGDLLRAERKKPNSSLGEEINHCISTGTLVKSEITCKLLESAMKEEYGRDQSRTKFLIDGFPRSHGNATVWGTTMGRHVVKLVLEFTCPEEILVGRLLERGHSSGRIDDCNIDTIRARFRTFLTETAPILEYYKSSSQRTVPVYTIQADQSVEDVYKNVAALFQSLDA